MSENMSVVIEVWPLAADEHGIWLISGDDAWRSAAVPADSEPHFEVELIVAAHTDRRPTLLHSTSWRPEGPRVVLTYVAVLDPLGPVRACWPGSRPVPAELLPVVGNPPPHEPAEMPLPRYVDVLHHGLRHLRFLLDTDAGARRALAGNWTLHLGKMAPALSGMYEAIGD